MLFIYPAIFHKENGSYWVEFPDLEGCHSYGDTIDETFYNAQEVLTGYLLALLETNKELPKSTELSLYNVADGFCSYVSVDLNQYRNTKAVKKTLTIPAWLNERAVAMNLNFSQVLQNALIASITKG